MSARHLIRILSVAVATTSAVVSQPLNSPVAHADPCPDVEVVFARGTGQDAGVGEVGQAFVDSLGAQINGLGRQGPGRQIHDAGALGEATEHQPGAGAAPHHVVDVSDHIVGTG